MITLSKNSNGHVKYSFKVALAANQLRTRKTESVSVPISISVEKFAFDFRSYLLSRGSTIKVSTKVVQNVATLVLKYSSLFGAPGVSNITDDGQFLSSSAGSVRFRMPKELDQALSDITPDMSPELRMELAHEAYIGVMRSVVRGGLTNALMLSSMDEKYLENAAQVFSSGLKPDLNMIISAISQIKRIYEIMCTSANIESIVVTFEEFKNSSELGRFVYALSDAFSTSSGPTGIAYLSDVIDQLLPACGLTPLVTSQYHLGALVEEVTDIDFPADVPKVAFMEYYLRLIRAFMDIPVDMSVPSTIEKYLQFGQDIAVTIPALPSDLLHAYGLAQKYSVTEEHMAAIEKLFLRFYFKHLISSVVKGEPGVLTARLRQILDERSYNKSEVFSAVINTGMTTLSLVFDPFLQAAADIRSIISSPDIFFTDERDWVLKIQDHWFEKIVGTLSTNYMPVTHPRSISEAALIVNQSTNPFTFDKPVYLLPDSMVDSYDTMHHDVYNDTYIQYYVRDFIKGSLWDAPIDLPDPVRSRRLYHDFSVNYAFVAPLPYNLSDLPEAQLMYRFPDIRVFYNLGIWNYMQTKGIIHIFTRVEQFARKFQLELATAQKIWANSAIAFPNPAGLVPEGETPASIVAGEYDGTQSQPTAVVLFEFTGSLDTLIFWKDSIGPIYEVGDQPEDFWIDPAMTLFPSALIAEDAGFGGNDSRILFGGSAQAAYKRGGKSKSKNNSTPQETEAEDSAPSEGPANEAADETEPTEIV